MGKEMVKISHSDIFILTDVKKLEFYDEGRIDIFNVKLVLNVIEVCTP